MEYKEYKKTGDNNFRGNYIKLSVILVCIIAVQFVSIVVMMVFNTKYKSLYDEALESQLVMQEEIIKLKDAMINVETEQPSDERQ